MESTASNCMWRGILDSFPTTGATMTVLYSLLILTGLLSHSVSAQGNNLATPMNCSSSNALRCTSYLSYFVTDSQNLAQVPDVAAYFGVNQDDILEPASFNTTSWMIQKDCSCNSSSGSGGVFFANASYTYTDADANSMSTLSEISNSHYGGLVFVPPTPPNLKPNVSIELQLLCGCPYLSYSTTITYLVRKGEFLTPLADTFQSKEDDIRALNNIPRDDNVVPGQVIFIPTNNKPSVPVPTQGSSTPASVKNSALVAGIITGVVVLLVLLLVTGCVFWCIRLKNHGVYRRSLVDNSGQASASGPVSGASFMGGLFHRSPNPHGANNHMKRSITLPREAMDVFDQEKPVVFYYKEITEATNNFDESRRVGEGSYGAVYSAVLRRQNVAIKQMKMTKSKEFYAELKVLCKVHHTNLVELIGYSVGDDSLCLIYEFAENGALNEHLHQRGNKPEEHLPLSWTTRVQIALDTARGLEYIHDHTKDHYVHRDVKTSNILLDGFFRAKVADFGLARLVEQNSMNFVSSSRLVGTFGYMAPELSQGGHATSKSDVYAFGVVLFELITGQQAMTRVVSGGRRSIISFMLEVLKEEHDPKLKFQAAVDPRLGDCFPLEWSFKMAKLARACVDEDPSHRPDMRTVVFSLSQFLLNSVEWEAALAGTSQIFSGLTQGR